MILAWTEITTELNVNQRRIQRVSFEFFENTINDSSDSGIRIFYTTKKGCMACRGKNVDEFVTDTIISQSFFCICLWFWKPLKFPAKIVDNFEEVERWKWSDLNKESNQSSSMIQQNLWRILGRGCCTISGQFICHNSRYVLQVHFAPANLFPQIISSDNTWHQVGIMEIFESI